MDRAKGIARGDSVSPGVVNDGTDGLDALEAQLIHHRDFIEQENLQGYELCDLGARSFAKIQLRLVLAIKLEHVVQSRRRDTGLLDLDI